METFISLVGIFSAQCDILLPLSAPHVGDCLSQLSNGAGSALAYGFRRPGLPGQMGHHTGDFLRGVTCRFETKNEDIEGANGLLDGDPDFRPVQ
jgi:hypothetical protein